MKFLTHLLCAIVLGLAAATAPARAAAPVITEAPTPRTVVSVGQPLTLSVTATGDTALTYQWKKNGWPIAGATTATYSNPAVTSQDGGCYTVIVTDGNGLTSVAISFVMIAYSPAQVVSWGGESDVPLGLGDVVDVRAGNGSAMAVKSDGTVVTWGGFYYGDITVPAGLSNVVGLADGGDCALALKSDGTVVAWGDNYYGETNIPAGLSNVVAVATGGDFSLALKADGSVVAWGYNSAGQATVPAGLGNVVAVACGGDYSLALKADGTVVAWGANYYGQTTVPAGLGNVVAVAAGGGESLALKGDGTVVAWGYNAYGQASVPTDLNKVVEVAAGYEFSMALKRDGTVVAWGANDSGQTTIPPWVNNVTQISAGSLQGLAIRDASHDVLPVITEAPVSQTLGVGNAVSWNVTATGSPLITYQWQKNGVPIAGATSASYSISSAQFTDAGSYNVMVANGAGIVTSDPGVLTVVPYPKILTAPAAQRVLQPGQSLNLSVTASGTAPLSYQWIKNAIPIAGATTVTYSKDTVAIQDGGTYTVVVTDGNGLTSIANALVVVEKNPAQVVAWGSSGVGVINPTAGSNHSVAISIGSQGYTLALKSDGTVVNWGDLTGFNETPLPASLDLNGVVAVAAGVSESVALKNDGTVVVWRNSDALKLALLAGLNNVIAVAAGGDFLALKSDGTVVDWGYDYNSNLYGQGSIPSNLSNLVAVAAGLAHVMALKSDGTVLDQSTQGGQMNLPVGLSNMVAIAAGDYHSLALKADGTVVAWGYNNHGQTTVPTGLNNVTAVAAGSDYSMALKTDGTVVAWGGNYYNQLNIPANLSNVLQFSAGGTQNVVLRNASQDPLPVITVAPSNQSQGIGTPLMLTATVSGSFLTYQWLKDGVAIPGATSVTYSVPFLQTSDAGSYTLTVTSGGGTVSSSAGVVTVLPQPTFTTIPALRNVLAVGQPLSLVAAATGTPPLSFQWMKNGMPIAGATSATYGVASLGRNDGGCYMVRVTDGTGLTSTAFAYVVISNLQTQRVYWGQGGSSQFTSPVGSSNVVSVVQGMTLAADGTVKGDPAVPPDLNNAVAVATGLALKADGTVVTWGDNSYGQATVPIGLNNVVAVAAGGGHDLALKADGTVVAWGRNTNAAQVLGGQSTVPPGLSNVMAVAAGDYYSLALRTEGTVVAWGDNSLGECNVPAGLTNVVAVAAGDTFAVALKADGTVVSWGQSNFGATAVPAGLTNVVAVTAGDYFSLALRADGTIVAWGQDYFGQTDVPVGLDNGIAVAAIGYYAVALRDCSKDTIPRFDSAPLTQTVEAGSPVVFSAAAEGDFLSYQWQKDGLAIAGANGTTLTLSNAQPSMSGNYTLVATNYLGSTPSSTALLTVVPLPVITRTPAAPIVGQALSLSAQASGQAPFSYQWAKNGVPIAGATESTYGNLALSGQDQGYYTVTVTDANGLIGTSGSMVHVSLSKQQVVAWGSNGSGESTVPANLGTVAAVAAGYIHSLVLEGDGTVVAFGNNTNGQTSVPAGLADVMTVAAGYAHSLALKGDGTVVAWGSNGFGQTTIPVGLGNVTAVSAGRYFNLALSGNGSVTAWGDNTYGQSTVPAGLNPVIGIAAGSYHALAVQSDGTVVAWGDSSSGKTAVPAGLSGVVAVAAGYSHSMALKSDGTVVAWGDNTYGQSSVPAGLGNVVALVAGDYHSMAQKSDGTVVAWGLNTSGQATVPSGMSHVKQISAGGYHSLVLRDASLDVALPIITTGPATITCAVGYTATFSVTATGALLTYQWQKNGVSIAGATASILALTTSAQLTDAGSYTVVVSNSVGSVTSDPAVLTVMPNPTINSPRNVLSPGQALNLSVTPAGTGPFSYQWKKNGIPLTGATGASFSLTNVGYSDAGWYTVEVTDGTGFTARTFAFVQFVSRTPQLKSWGAVPTLTTGTNSVAAISAGTFLALMLETNGTVVASSPPPGLRNFGQTLVPGGLSNAVAVAAGRSLGLALKADGTVTGWGTFGSTTVSGTIAGLTNIVAVAASWYDGLALRADGTVLGIAGASVPANLTNVVAISDGSYGGNYLALKADGTVVAWGTNPYAQSSVPAGLGNVVAVSAGDGWSLALKADGTVVAWGSNANGQCNVPFGLNNVVAISAGENHALALKSDGTVVAWGASTSGQISLPASLTKVYQITAGYNFSLAMRDNTADVTPIVTVPPASQTVQAGHPVTFSVTATGSFLGYQWFHNGTSIYGATSASFTMTTVLPVNAGNYTVKVTSGASSVSSPAAVLTVTSPPVITSATSATFVAGQAGNFTLTATAVPTATYSATGLPPWAALDGNTGIISGTPPDTSGSPFSVAVAASNGISPNAAQTLTVSVLTPFAAWQNANFTAGELANPAISGPTIALGPDGVPNLLKYALGVAPRAALPLNAQAVAQAGGNWTYTYQRPSNCVDLVYAVEVSTDLQTWSGTGVTLQRTATADANGMETWQGSCTNSGPNLFFRLRVTAP